MIPVRLVVRNFMPYRDNVPPLDFGHIHTASICGDNGNGKSALIDAMTWALWGETRAKSDDDLIHIGQTEAAVEFDFAVGQQVYRVMRKHARPKRQKASGQTILELQIATNNGFMPISGSTIPETQKKIIGILHMDYDTFINSAFLRQGHADEFTRQTPSKRKDVLASILELSRYDELEGQARDLTRKLEADKAQAESAIKDIDDELARKPAYEAELEQAQSELSRIEKVMGEQESGLNELRQRIELLKNKQSQWHQLEERISQAGAALKLWDEDINRRRQVIREYEELMARRGTIEESYARFMEAKKLKDELDQKLTLYSRLNQRQHELEMVVERAQAALVTQHKMAEGKIAELEAVYQKLPRLKDGLQQLQADLVRLAGEEEVLRQRKQSRQEQRDYVREMESNQARLQQEISGIEEKLGLLLTESGAKCPLCETELGVGGLQLIESKYTADKQGKSVILKANQTELARKKKELEGLEGEIARLEARLNQDKVSLQSQAGRLNHEVTIAEEAGQQLEVAREKLAEVEERLAGKDFTPNEQVTLRQLEAELARLGYEASRHEQVRQQLAGLESYDSPKRKLEEADRLIDQEKASVSRAEQAVEEQRRTLEADKQQWQALTEELKLLPRLSGDLARAEAERQALSGQQRQAQEIVGRVKGKLQHCAELETKKGEKAGQLNQATRDEGVYRELAEAFGKSGIQAWLIESTFPEIEAEANKLLGRMTDNRMNIKFESQRANKKGNVVETLDIKIADELGTRNYEMFSGGETFRINFAIRVALSKLLAHRAGAPLRTLIVDEGFGTQDSTGLEKLKEAIISIQDDFDKILIITHVEELRDAFPVRIDVIKTAEGSTIEVS